MGKRTEKEKKRDEGCTHLMRMLVVLGCAEYCMVVYSPPRTFSMFIKVWFLSALSELTIVIAVYYKNYFVSLLDVL